MAHGASAHRPRPTRATRKAVAIAEAAVLDTLPARVTAAPGFADRLPGLTAWVVDILRTAESGQPALAREPRDAGGRGDVVHEARVQVDLDGKRVEGTRAALRRWPRARTLP